jgi:hypothetical protein
LNRDIGPTDPASAMKPTVIIIRTNVNMMALMNLAELVDGRRPREISHFRVNLIRETH